MPDAPRTTVVACVVQNGAATWLHCGDSRLYWVREGKLLARTRDHSYMEMERNATMPVRLAQKLLNRNVLFTCLWASGKPIFDVSGPHTLHSGDRLLLCSDGLWGALKEPALLHGLAELPVAQAIPALVESALQITGEKSGQRHRPGCWSGRCRSTCKVPVMCAPIRRRSVNCLRQPFSPRMSWMS